MLSVSDKKNVTGKTESLGLLAESCVTCRKKKCRTNNDNNHYLILRCQLSMTRCHLYFVQKEVKTNGKIECLFVND